MRAFAARCDGLGCRAPVAGPQCHRAPGPRDHIGKRGAPGACSDHRDAVGDHGCAGGVSAGADSVAGSFGAALSADGVGGSADGAAASAAADAAVSAEVAASVAAGAACAISAEVAAAFSADSEAVASDGSDPVESKSVAAAVPPVFSLPLVGRGRGWGSRDVALLCHRLPTPHPDPPPQGGREKAAPRRGQRQNRLRLASVEARRVRQPHPHVTRRLPGRFRSCLHRGCDRGRHGRLGGCLDRRLRRDRLGPRSTQASPRQARPPPRPRVWPRARAPRASSPDRAASGRAARCRANPTGRRPIARRRPRRSSRRCRCTAMAAAR